MEKVAKLLILACLFLSCEKEDETSKYCFNMEISNSLPIQFWVNGEETFNQKVVCGMTRVCWCQPFNCSDEIRLVFTDTPGQANSLIVTYDDTTFYIAFSEISSGVYELIFTANEHGLCGKSPEFYIKLFSGLSFTEEPSAWTDGGGDPFDSRTATEFINSTAGSQAAYQLMDGGNGDSIVINYIVTISGITIGAADVDFVIADSSGTPLSTILDEPYQSNFQENGVYNITFKRTIDSVTPAARLYLFTSYIGGGSPIITIELAPDQIFNAGLTDYKAKSDCVSFKTSHACTLLLDYSNATYFDGVVDSSPIQSFNLRIPAVFFEEVNPQEQEDIELSNDEIVRLYNKVEEQRTLRVGFMPHYMHRKLLMALVHDFVTIDGKQWIKRDEYRKNEGDRHYPLRTAQVLLTDKNFIKENQL